MKILVYGAGNIGSLYAALLRNAGQEVSILARGSRLAEVREHGIELEHAATGKQSRVLVDVVERLDAEDAYDLILVALPGHKVSEVLPILASNRGSPSVLFFGNNAAGPGELIEALGRDRVLLGFPGAAGVVRDRRLHYLITSAREQPTTIGELDGSRSSRIEATAGALRAAGFPAAVCPNMDAWLKTHAAEISPTANALYMVAGDHRQLAQTRDALVLMVRAIREGYRVLAARGIPVTPASHRLFRWVPEPLLLALLRRIVASESTAIKVGHARDARPEMKVLAHELRALARSTSVSTPAMDRLYRYVDPAAVPVDEGSAELPLHWGGVVVLGAVLIVAILSLSML